MFLLIYMKIHRSTSLCVIRPNIALRNKSKPVGIWRCKPHSCKVMSLDFFLYLGAAPNYTWLLALEWSLDWLAPERPSPIPVSRDLPAHSIRQGSAGKSQAASWQWSSLFWTPAKKVSERDKKSMRHWHLIFTHYDSQFLSNHVARCITRSLYQHWSNTAC